MNFSLLLINEYLSMIQNFGLTPELFLHSPWDYGNQVLYDLCRDNFLHVEDDKIIAKVWLIGRAYAASIERGRKTESINDDFYIKDVAPIFRNSELDKMLLPLKDFNRITEENLISVLQAHNYFVKLALELTGLEKRSLGSKYLHFHLPDLFFIYDSRVVRAMRKIVKKVPANLKYVLNSNNIDKEYAKYVCKCLYLKNYISEHRGFYLSPRQLDRWLINQSNTELSKSKHQAPIQILSPPAPTQTAAGRNTTR